MESDRQRQRNRLHALRHAPAALVMTNLQQQIDFLSDQITQVKRTLQDHINHHPDLKADRDLRASIEGIGDLTAAKLLGELGDLSQFTDVRQVVAFAGLNPHQRQSGSSVRGRTTISKMGRASIRAALYMPAVVAKHHNTRLAALTVRLEAQGLCNMQILAALMRKLLHFAFGVLKSRRPYLSVLEGLPS